jgi:hypothetical protein
MKRNLSVSFSLAILCLVAACATTPPTTEEISALGYGEPLTIDYKTSIKKYFEESLIDPFSAHIKIGEPQQYSYRDSLIEGRKVYAGYAVPAKVNAKNRMGGYVGWKDYIFLFRNNQLSKILTPEDLALMRTK